MTENKCGYPGCDQPAGQVWNSPQYGYMCTVHCEQESTQWALERFFAMDLSRLQKDIDQRSKQLQTEYDRMPSPEHIKNWHNLKIKPMSMWWMIPAWERGLKIAKAVYEART